MAHVKCDKVVDDSSFSPFWGLKSFWLSKEEKTTEVYGTEHIRKNNGSLWNGTCTMHISPPFTLMGFGFFLGAAGEFDGFFVCRHSRALARMISKVLKLKRKGKPKHQKGACEIWNKYLQIPAEICVFPPPARLTSHLECNENESKKKSGELTMFTEWKTHLLGLKRRNVLCYTTHMIARALSYIQYLQKSLSNTFGRHVMNGVQLLFTQRYGYIHPCYKWDRCSFGRKHECADETECNFRQIE